MISSQLGMISFPAKVTILLEIRWFILGHFFGDTQVHGQNSLMVTGSHLYFTPRAIYHHPLKCIYKFLLVYCACLLKGFSNEMGSDVTMESWEPRRSSITS